MAHHYDLLSNFAFPVVWVKCQKGQLLPKGLNPVFGGLSVENGEPTYVARAKHQDNTIPGRLVPSKSTCYVGHCVAEHAYSEYQVLTKQPGTRLEWVPDQNGHVPDGAVVGGQQADGTKLYIGRVYHDDFGICGKVHREHRVLYIALNCNEHRIEKYEVLALSEMSSLKWIDCEDGQIPDSLFNPVMSGITAKGEPTYVGRAQHETRQRHQEPNYRTHVTARHGTIRNVTTRLGATYYHGTRTTNGSREIVMSHLIPGRVVPSQKKCYVGHSSNEYSYSRYQVLTNPFEAKLEWMPARDGHLPDGALLGGQSDGVKLYIGRLYNDGFAISGKIVPENKMLYIASDGTEWRHNKYEVLVDTEKLTTNTRNHGVTM